MGGGGPEAARSACRFATIGRTERRSSGLEPAGIRDRGGGRRYGAAPSRAGENT